MGFDPSLIQLTNLYTDAITFDRSTDVFTNGSMQVAVFPTFNYFGDPKDVPQAIYYVATNIQIMILNDDGSMTPCQWSMSPMSNKFQHDVYRETNIEADNDGQTRNIRSSCFLLVPKLPHSISEKWCAKLGDQITSTTYPVIVEAKPYIADPKEFEIVDKGTLDNSILRVMKYKLGDGGRPEHHRLIKHISINGVKFTRHGNYGPPNVFILMSMKEFNYVSSGGFLDYQAYDHIYPATPIESRKDFFYDEKIRDLNEYPESYPNPAPEEYFLKYDEDLMRSAWDEGIVMYQHGLQYMLLYNADILRPLYFETRNEIIIEDNFGNRIEIDIDWNVNEKRGHDKDNPGPMSYYKYWKVVKAVPT